MVLHVYGADLVIGNVVLDLLVLFVTHSGAVVLVILVVGGEGAEVTVRTVHELFDLHIQVYLLEELGVFAFEGRRGQVLDARQFVRSLVFDCHSVLEGRRQELPAGCG